MEVRIDVMNHEGDLFSSSYYLMVCRDKDTHKAKKVPQLMAESEATSALGATLEKSSTLNLKLGEKRQEQRKLIRSDSIFKKPPNSIESQQLHNLFLKDVNKPGQAGALDKVKTDSKKVKISETRVEKIILKHNQDKNVHGKTFGGLLMRESIELAFICAYQQSGGEKPQIYHVDDVHFVTPVDIGKLFFEFLAESAILFHLLSFLFFLFFILTLLGSVVRYVAHMTYSEGKVVNVKVDVEKVKKLENRL